GIAILRRVVAGDNGKLLNRVHAEVRAEHVSWSGIGVVVDDKAVEPVGILRRPISVNAYLRSQAAPYGANLRDQFLSAHAGHTGLQGGERRPVAAIQRQLAYSGGVNLSAEGGVGRLNRRGRSRDFDDLGHLSDLQGYIHLLLRAYGERHFRLRGAETRCGRGYFVVRRIEVRDAKSARGIGGGAGRATRGEVLGRNLCIGDGVPPRVGDRAGDGCANYL